MILVRDDFALDSDETMAKKSGVISRPCFSTNDVKPPIAERSWDSYDTGSNRPWSH